MKHILGLLYCMWLVLFMAPVFLDVGESEKPPFEITHEDTFVQGTSEIFIRGQDKESDYDNKRVYKREIQRIRGSDVGSRSTGYMLIGEDIRGGRSEPG